VLKLDPNVFHHGGLGVVRSLGRLGVPVHVVHEDAFAPAAASRYVQGRWRWTPGSDDPERVRQGLLQLADRLGQPAVLLPTDDAGAIFLAEHGEPLRASFLFAAPAPHLPRQVADKASLTQLCWGRDLHCPLTALPASVEDAMAFVDRAGLPVYAKLAAPWLRTGERRRRSTTRLGTRDAVTALAEEYAAARLLLQEHVPGTDWFFHGYCDEFSICRPAYTGIKERSYPPHAGLTTLGRAVPNDRLRALVQRLLVDLRYQGIVDMDLRWDARNDRFLILDFNPRVGAQFRVFQDAAGLDVVRAAYLDLTGQPVPDLGAVPGRRFLVENYDLLAALSYVRRRELGLWDWMRTLRGVQERAWFARDDLAPFGLMCLRLVWRAAQRPARPMPAHRPRSLRFRPGRAANPSPLSAVETP
jgi:D-aspartate ligase